MPRSSADRTVAALLDHRRAFRAFIVSRVGSEADADDLLQQGLIKALAHAGDLREDEKSVAWFYQILRHTIVDFARSRSARRRRDEIWTTDPSLLNATDPEAERHICHCFAGLLPTMKPAHAELLRRVELEGESVSSAARDLGLTANHASVALHRARQELRKKLVAFCGDCARGNCRDCDCAS